MTTGINVVQLVLNLTHEEHGLLRIAAEEENLSPEALALRILRDRLGLLDGRDWEYEGQWLEVEDEPGNVFGPFVAERPIHAPDQIHERDELIIDREYIVMEGGYPIRFRVIGQPFTRNGSWWIKVEYVSNRLQLDRALTDMGIEPYDNGLWNRNNYVVKT